MKKQASLIKWITALIAVLVGIAITTPVAHAKTHRRTGIDVSSYQESSEQFFMTKYSQGARFAIVKLGGSGGFEGYHYQNPKASQQLAMAQKVGMDVGGYYWGQFGGSTTDAKRHANFAVADAKKFGLVKGSVIALDYEDGASASVSANTTAILAFMKSIKDQGYKPLLYSGAYYLKVHTDRNRISKVFKNSLWVASYATMNPVTKPDYNYFPSMEQVAVWQYSPSWYGVDANIELLKGTMDKLGSVKHDVKVTKTTKSKAKTYTVKAGDSWESIAKKYGMDANQLAKLNKKTTKSMLRPGDKLKLVGVISDDAKPVKAKIVTVKKLGKGKESWQVRLISGKGKYTNRYVKQGSKWLTTKSKQTSKGKAYLIGKDLYILAKFVK